MIFRSILFYTILSFWTILLGLLSLPFLILPSKYLRKPICIWIAGIFLFLRYICKITHEVQGTDNIPKKAVLVASKHQSAFETFALFYYLPKSVFIHKKQLFLIPIFGQYLKKISMISIDRKGGASTMRLMLKETKKKLLSGFSIIIFPEGTRKRIGETPDYKTGLIGLYKELHTEILPIALNSGKCWPKNIFIKNPGHIIIRFLPLIDSKLDRKKILMEVQERIETATNNII
jgi:1-acyl-sn-glycerol-3-phosphate acyltransferase